MKKKLLGSLVLMSLSLPTFASGVRGGGHVVEVNGNLELLDIVTNATCNWFSGKEIITQRSHVQKILNKIEKLDWYVALELKREIEYLSWCLTGNLYSVPSTDDDSFVRQLNRGVQQAAFRFNENAYIDSTKLSRLSQSSQAYLIFHEALHSYLSMGTDMRIFKLQSLVSTIRRVDLGQITTRESLNFNLSRNDMEFVFSTNKLDVFRKSLEFLLSDVDTRIVEILKAQAPEKLVHQNIQAALPYLAKWDRPVVASAQKILTGSITEVFKRGNLDDVKIILHQQTFEKINPAALALSIIDELSEEVRREVTLSNSFKKIIKESANKLGKINFTLVENRITADLSLQSITEQCQESRPVPTTSLTGLYKNSNCELPSEIIGLVDLIVFTIKSQEMSTFDTQILNNQELIRSLRLEIAFESLRLLVPAIPREKVLAEAVLGKIQKSFVDQLDEVFFKRLSFEDYQKIQPFLKKLGTK